MGLAVGIPITAVVFSEEGTVFGGLTLAFVIGSVGLYLWRHAGLMQVEYRSGAEHIAELLAHQTTPEPGGRGRDRG